MFQNAMSVWIYLLMNLQPPQCSLLSLSNDFGTCQNLVYFVKISYPKPCSAEMLIL